MRETAVVRFLFFVLFPLGYDISRSCAPLLALEGHGALFCGISREVARLRTSMVMVSGALAAVRGLFNRHKFRCMMCPLPFPALRGFCLTCKHKQRAGLCGAEFGRFFELPFLDFSYISHMYDRKRASGVGSSVAKK